MRTLTVVAIGLALSLGCDALLDPAVRLAYCLEQAVENDGREGTTVSVTCDPGTSGSFLVVLHPEGDLSDSQLLSAGVPQALLAELRELRLGDRAAIYVIAADPEVTGTGTARSVLSSFTTYQNRFVRIPRLLVLRKSTQSVTFDIGGAVEARVVEAMR